MYCSNKSHRVRNNPGYSVRKLKCGLTNFTQNMGHIDFIYANKSLICLNTTTFSDLNLLILSLTLLLVCKSDYIQNSTFHIIIDSKFIYCFIDTTFVLKYSILIKLTLSVELKLFNRSSNNIITKTAFLPVTFPSGNQMILNLYIISLKFSYSLVLRYYWLIQHNLTINWAIGFITF